MAHYEPLPEDYRQARPVLERVLVQQAARNHNQEHSRRRPDPPRSVIPQAGTAKGVVTWVGPADMRGIIGWKVYSGNENMLFKTISDLNERRVEIPLAANEKKLVAVSSWNGKRESIRVAVIVGSDSNQYVVTGTGGATAGSNPDPPPEWPNEPGGGYLESQ